MKIMVSKMIHADEYAELPHYSMISLYAVYANNA